jgi:hypothetical protein
MTRRQFRFCGLQCLLDPLGKSTSTPNGYSVGLLKVCRKTSRQVWRPIILLIFKTGNYGAWSVVESTRLVCDTSSCRVRSSSRRFVQRANQPRCLTRRPSSQPPNFEERDVEPGRGDRKIWKFSEMGRFRCAKVQFRCRGGKSAHFIYFLSLPNSTSFHERCQPTLCPSIASIRILSGSAWA